MKKNDKISAPLFNALVDFAESHPISFHVPGHKDGTIFSAEGLPFFKNILRLDKTELTGLDDLHAATGIIEEAQQLAADYFQADKTFFLVGGSTVGNLAMILAICQPGDSIIVQRNSHKSILNALELAGARPVFLSPHFDENTGRYAAPSTEAIIEALNCYPDSVGIVLTYPDYFGSTYPLHEIIQAAHKKDIPVLIDEAHGVHFSSSHQFPDSALELGADIVVQSAHKMAPALTMASFLHMHSALIDSQKVAHYLQVLQSSSPSYPMLASLDLARFYLSSLSEEQIKDVLESTERLRNLLNTSKYWEVEQPTKRQDPLKITITGKEGLPMKQVAALFEKEGIYPELATNTQILFLHGLDVFKKWEAVKLALENMEEELKNMPRHATIGSRRIPQTLVKQLVFSYEEMKQKQIKFVSWQEARGEVAAESIIPYPPGIPLVSKGERLTEKTIELVLHMIKQGINFQHTHINQGIKVFVSG